MDLFLPIFVALIVSVMAPYIMSHQLNRQRHDEKVQDWARQDLVALQAAEAAALLVESNTAQAKAAEVLSKKIDVVHTLVNSDMTKALEGELGALEGQLVLLLESRKTAAHAAQVKTVRARIAGLKTTLATRSEDAIVVAQQVAQIHKAEEEP